MPDRTYDGPYPAVDLILAGGAVRVEKGETVPVSDDEAKSLDAQGDWLESAAKKSDPTPPAAAPAAAPSS